MIISASRRTDIPAFYSQWFYNRIRAGFCEVRNPFNPKQISVVNLKAENVDAIVFWTRNPRPFMRYLDELDTRGYKYYFLFTLNNYPRIYEPYRPLLYSALESFRELSARIGAGKVIWRYDPILITDDLTLSFHLNNYEKIASALSGFTKRVIISIVDNYRKTLRRLNKLNVGYLLDQRNSTNIERLLKGIVQISDYHNIKVKSCAEAKDYDYLGIAHGKCIDDELLRNEFGVDVKYNKDKGQRKNCLCTVSKDIGAVDTCLIGCEYCYATRTHYVAVGNRQRHNPYSPAIID